MSIVTQPLEPIELASRDELTALQLSRLRSLLAHAYANVPMYRKKFDAMGVHSDDLRDLSDLARFPFTVKDDFRQHYPFGMLAVPREQTGARARVVRNNGTADGRWLHGERHQYVG